MKDLIEALQIFAKYTDSEHPTGGGHDVFYVFVNPSNVDAKDIARLSELGFKADEGLGSFYSYRFG